MWESVKILLLGKAVLLTPDPIDIGRHWVHLVPTQPLTAIESSAHVEIHVPWSTATTPSPSLRAQELEAKYSHGCVRAKLLSKGRAMASFELRDKAPEKAAGILILKAERALPLKVEFDELQLRASCRLQRVTVEWRNDGAQPEAQ